jgi:hypothetical protein
MSGRWGSSKSEESPLLNPTLQPATHGTIQVSTAALDIEQVPSLWAVTGKRRLDTLGVTLQARELAEKEIVKGPDGKKFPLTTSHDDPHLAQKLGIGCTLYLKFVVRCTLRHKNRHVCNLLRSTRLQLHLTVVLAIMALANVPLMAINAQGPFWKEMSFPRSFVVQFSLGNVEGAHTHQNPCRAPHSSGFSHSPPLTQSSAHITANTPSPPLLNAVAAQRTELRRCERSGDRP